MDPIISQSDPENTNHKVHFFTDCSHFHVIFGHTSKGLTDLWTTVPTEELEHTLTSLIQV